jgi:hypothetical protein
MYLKVGNSKWSHGPAHVSDAYAGVAASREGQARATPPGVALNLGRPVALRRD